MHGALARLLAPAWVGLQSEAELALLGNDELAAAAASLALSRGAGEDAGSGGSGAASPERAGSPSRRWLGRALPSSPSRYVHRLGAGAVAGCKRGRSLSVAAPWAARSPQERWPEPRWGSEFK